MLLDASTKDLKSDKKTMKMAFILIFSSPEHKVLTVSYGELSLSVVCALLSFCLKWLLLQNG